jgi:hypothetical protein
VPVLQGQAKLPDFIHIGTCDGLTKHSKIIALTVTEQCIFSHCEQLYSACEIWGSHGGEDDDDDVLGFDAV